MRIRHISLGLLAFLLLGAPDTRAEEPRPEDAVRTMADAERKFYQTGQENGTRAAFLTFLANDGIVFRPGPVNGKEVWEKKTETGFDLIWQPTFASIARSADFGYTTGPAKWRASKKDEKFLGYGHFVSIWRKQPNGSWRVALDLGIENPEPTGPLEPLRLFVPEAQQVKTANVRRKALPLQEAQEEFMKAAKVNSTDATLGAAAEEIRIYRDGSFPAIGKDAAGALLNAKAGTMSFEPMGGETSRSADLAYGYGKYTLKRGENAEAGHFFQIWQTDPVGVWKLVLDWQQPLPKEKP